MNLIHSTSEIDAEKIASLDMGGTLVGTEYIESTNGALNVELGMDPKKESQMYGFHQGKDGDIRDHISYSAAQNSQLLDVKPSLQDYAEAVRMVNQDRRVFPAAEMFVDDLKDRGYETMILSSAPKALVTPYAKELGVDNVYCWKDFDFDENGRFKSVYVNPEAQKGKHQIIERLKDEGKTVIHFGNGDNDREACNAADLGIKQWWQTNPERAYLRAINEVDNFEN